MHNRFIKYWNEIPLYYSDLDPEALKSLSVLLRTSQKPIYVYLDGHIYTFNNTNQMKMFAEGIDSYFILKLDE